MNVMINWEKYTDEELEQIQGSLFAEIKERKERVKYRAIQDFLKAYHDVKNTGIDVYICGEYITENDFEFC